MKHINDINLLAYNMFFYLVLTHSAKNYATNPDKPFGQFMDNYGNLASLAEVYGYRSNIL